MKKVLKKFLLCILIIVIASNFALGNFLSNVAYAEETGTDGIKIFNDALDLGGDILSGVLSGLIGVLIWPFTIVPTAILIGVESLIGALAKVGLGDITFKDGIDGATTLTPIDILFNRVPITDINFFDFNGVNGTILQFRQLVAGWYYTMRLIATMLLLVVLIYIGIRMALTSIATEKAMYKKMLVDWVTSLALLFLLHYIMLFVITCNNVLVNAIGKIAASDVQYGNMMAELRILVLLPTLVTRITALIIYGSMIFFTISFLISYIKRMFTIGFLIIIAPLITITYSIDKIGDGKSQALNTWLKEFSYNILLQPFQCILYLVFAKVAFDSLFTWGSVGRGIFAILGLWFIKEGEKIVKKIFGFGKASTAGDLAAGAALTAGALLKGKEVAKKAGGTVSKLKNTIGSSEAAKKFRANRENKKIDKINEKHFNGNATAEQKDKIREEIRGNRRFTSKKKIAENVRNREKNEEKLEKDAETAWNNSDKKDKKEDFIKEYKKNHSKPEDKKNISGVKKNFWNNTATGQAIKGIWNYAKDNKAAIGAMGVGMFTAGMGFAAGDFGDISKVVVGFGMGKGFSEGLYENSAKTLRQNSEAYAQMLSNLTNDSDTNNHLAIALAMDPTELSKDIKAALQELTNSLRRNGFDDSARASMTGSFSKTAQDEEKAGNITVQSIEKMLEDNGFNGTESEKQELISNFAEYGKLLGYRSLHSNVKNAEAMGTDAETLAYMIGNKEVQGYKHYEKTTTKESSSTEENVQEITEKYKKFDVGDLAEEINKKVSGRGVFVKNIDETNRKIDELNGLLDAFKSKTADEKREIESIIRANNSSFNSVLDSIDSQMKIYEKKRTKFEKQNGGGEG